MTLHLAKCVNAVAFRGEREGPAGQRREGEVGRRRELHLRPLTPTLSPHVGRVGERELGRCLSQKIIAGSWVNAA